MKLEKSEIDPLACTLPQRDKLFFDDDLQGFCLRVTHKGAKTWLLQYRHPSGSTKRVTLGRYPELTPFQARRMAEKARATVLLGGDPAGDRTKARQVKKAEAAVTAFTVSALVTRWDEVALRDRSPNYRAEAVRALTRALAPHWSRAAAALEVAHVQTVLDTIGKAHPTTARRVRSYGRAAFGWAVRRQLVAVNPFAAAEAEGREVARDRVLSDQELGEVWRASDGQASKKLSTISCAFVRIALLTLQRRGEVAGMRWAELSGDGAIWTIPAERAKNGLAHTVHLAKPAQRILATLVRRPDATLVFETYSHTRKGKVAAISGFSDIQEQLRRAIATERAARPGIPAKDASAPDWHMHDFRRTGVTVLASVGVSPHVADRILNHVGGSIRGVAAVYQRHDFLAERKSAMDIWASHVFGAAHPNKAAKLKGGTVASRVSED